MRSTLILVLCLLTVWMPPASGQDFSSALDAARRGGLKSLVIADGAGILAQTHQRGGALRRPTNVKSVSKSLLSALVGIAVERGDLELDQPIAGFFPEHAELFADPRRARITVQDLLTMRSGLETTSFYNYGSWVAGRDWVRGQLAQPVIAEPGTAMKYSTGASHLMSVILERATQLRPRDFARQVLTGPMGVGAVGWETDPQGHDFGGNNLTMTPLQMVALGQLYLNDGRHDGRQVVPEGWVRASWEPRTRSSWNGYSYGYFWWLRQVAGRRVCYAWGHGGQRIFVMPDLDLVVVTTAPTGPSGRRRGEMMHLMDRLLADHIIPAVDASH